MAGAVASGAGGEATIRRPDEGAAPAADAVADRGVALAAAFGVSRSADVSADDGTAAAVEAMLCPKKRHQNTAALRSSTEFLRSPRLILFYSRR